MFKNTFVTALGCATLLTVLVVLGCESSDVIAPEDSTITLNFTPSTIILSGGVQAGDITVLATVSNSLGVPLPGQDVRFTTSTGELDPPGGTPVRTDSSGNAITSLSLAQQSATVTARSGKTTASQQINTATCNLATVNLSVSQISLELCTDTFPVTATAIKSDGNPCPGVQIRFRQVEVDPDTDVTLSFTPGSGTANESGEVTTTLSVSVNNCDAKCANGETCAGRFEAVAGAVASDEVDVVDNVP